MAARNDPEHGIPISATRKRKEPENHDVNTDSEDDNPNAKSTKAKAAARATEKQNDLRRQQGNKKWHEEGGGRVPTQKNLGKENGETPAMPTQKVNNNNTERELGTCAEGDKENVAP